MPAVMQQVLAAGGPSAAVTYVGSSSSASTTLTIPTHQAGDLIIIGARRNGNTTPPSLPAGWTDIQNGGAFSFSSRVGYIIAAGSGTVSGTWTNADHLVCSVYRPVLGTLSIGASSPDSGSFSAVDWAPLTLLGTNQLSWVVAYYFNTQDSSYTVIRSGIMPRGYETGLTTVIIGTGDTAGPVSSWVAETTTGPVTGVWRTVAVEIRITPT